MKQPYNYQSGGKGDTKMNNSVFKKQTGLLIIALWLIVNLTGCEAFVRKFTRKPKKDSLPREEIVAAPQEYKAPVMSREEQYRQYFLYWKSWQDELINSLTNTTNPKKQIGCIAEAIKNLQELKGLLKEEKQKILSDYINQMERLKNAITQDIYGIHAVTSRYEAERLRRDILQLFSYPKIKDYLA